MSSFLLDHWCAWTPGSTHHDPRLLDAADTKAPSFVPKMLLRRLSPLAKAVFNVANACVENGVSYPVVFSSAHGEICRSLIMLQTIQAGEALSPAAFSLSVHSAIAGLYSIASGNSQEISVIAPGLEGIAPAFIEAVGLLEEGAGSVLILLYDEPIASFYPVAPFKLNSAFPCVAGLRVSFKGQGIRLTLERSFQNRTDGEHPLQIMALIEFLLSDAESLTLGNLGHTWSWRKY